MKEFGSIVVDERFEGGELCLLFFDHPFHGVQLCICCCLACLFGLEIFPLQFIVVIRNSLCCRRW